MTFTMFYEENYTSYAKKKSQKSKFPRSKMQFPKLHANRATHFWRVRSAVDEVARGEERRGEWLLELWMDKLATSAVLVSTSLGNGSSSVSGGK